MKLYTIYSASEAEQALILSQIPLIGQLQEPAIAPTTVFWRISTRSLKPG